MKEKKFCSISELAKILNISRQAVLKKINNGQIEAEKIGKSYIIEKNSLKGIICDCLTDKLKEEIDLGVACVVREYDDTLKLLGKE